MNKDTSITCDVVVIGSGFSGSLTALCLHQAGLEVCVIEKGRHPRFAIGESSTPIADMILRDLADAYDLSWLKYFSRYGSWQQHYPEIACGLKRGFSYFKHKPGKPFTTNASHENELLVAASTNDKQSDTNWLRSDFDAFLVEKLKEYKIPYFDQTEITAVENNHPWNLRAERNNTSFVIQAGFFVDATGSPNFLNKFFGIESTTEGFHTYSHALFSHFTGAHPWKNHIEDNGIPTGDYPYNPDYSALHHLLDEGWMWMLRFNDGRTSAGFSLNSNETGNKANKSPEEQWSSLLAKYPSIKSLFENAELAKNPGHLIKSGRLQRRLSQAAGDGWAALPHTTGFVDPMHSTGIAHTLSGVEKLVGILSGSVDKKEQLKEKLINYEKSVFKELQLIDLLVAGSYNSLHNFHLFNTYVMLYFIAAINYEQERLVGKIPDHFLCADDPAIMGIVEKSYLELNSIPKSNPNEKQIHTFREWIKNSIEPYNSAGLLNASARNMYRHTAVNF